ncbi:PriCT-2 domain-containing protein, partial [Acinetobacter baumannii]
MSSLKEPHEQDAARMLSFLHGDDAHTFQTVPEGGQRQSAQILHGHLDKCIATLTELNTSGSGVFVCVNETDLKGRKSDNIIRVRALCADFDAPDSHRVEWLLSLSLPPNMIIESSPGKHHAYWVFNVGEISLTEFRPLQQRIAMVLGSDEKICDLSRVLRVAGFWHQKGEPFLTNICHIGDYYTTDQIKDFVWSLKSGSHSELDSHFQTSSEMLKLGDMPPHIKQAKHITTLWNTVAPLYSTNIEEIEEVLSFIPGDDRKIWVDVGIALRNSNFENAYDIWCRWSAKSDKYDTYEQQKNWDTFEGYNRVTLGKIYHLAAKHGYKRSSVDSLTCGQNSVLADVLDTPEVPAALDIHTVIGEIKKLAELTMIEYELKREGEAKRLGLRASKLDEFVKLYRRTDVKDVFFEEVSMWHEVVDGTVLLEEIENTIKKFIISEPHIATAAALWIVFTWCIDVM